MAQWWFWIIVVIGSLVLGFGTIAFFWFMFDAWRNRRIKKKLPKDPEELKAETLNPGKQTTNVKEVREENERKQFTKYREFEKLRQLGEGTTSDSRAAPDSDSGTSSPGTGSSTTSPAPPTQPGRTEVEGKGSPIGTGSRILPTADGVQERGDKMAEGSSFYTRAFSEPTSKPARSKKINLTDP